jgi:hypothetical protein
MEIEAPNLSELRHQVGVPFKADGFLSRGEKAVDWLAVRSASGDIFLPHGTLSVRNSGVEGCGESTSCREK